MPEHPILPIVYHHKGILVVDKPHGMPSQPSKTSEVNDVYGLLQQQFPYVGLHHRLDQPASGLLLLSTNQRWNSALSQAFQQHQISRGYIIWVVGTPPDNGTWRFKLDGKKAVSAFKTIHRHDDQAILAVQLYTGRTHQIRRHAAKAGYPIIGDKRYGGIAGALWPRLALHAMNLRFTHPATQEAVDLSAQIPEDLFGILGEETSRAILSQVHSSIYPNNFNC